MPDLPGKRILVFDRDNTLIIADGYLGDPTRVKLMPGAASAVARARAMGFAVVVTSNQSGVARGLFTEDDVKAVDRRLAELLRAENPSALIDRAEYCPYHPAAALLEYRQDSELRKPKPGMILKAVSELGLQANGWCIGDAPRDIAAGKAAGLRTVLFSAPGVPRSPAADEPVKVQPDFTAASLDEAMTIIEREEGKSIGSPVVSVPDMKNVERLLEQLLIEVKRVSQPHNDFSVSKMFAGVIQVLVLALLVVTYISQESPNKTVTYLLLAIVLQMLVSSLLLMGRR